jgi:hypothetical protein
MSDDDKKKKEEEVVVVVESMCPTDVLERIGNAARAAHPDMDVELIGGCACRCCWEQGVSPELRMSAKADPDAYVTISCWSSPKGPDWTWSTKGIDREHVDMMRQLYKTTSDDGKTGFDIFWCYVATVLAVYAERKKKKEEEDQWPIEEVD